MVGSKKKPGYTQHKFTTMKLFQKRFFHKLVFSPVPFLFAVHIIFFFSCEKEPVVELPVNEKADDPCFHFQGPVQGSELVSLPYYMNPVFNPLNSNEFVCIEHFYDTIMDEILVLQYNLIKYNIKTGERQVLIEKFPQGFGKISWSRTGWIAFCTNVNNISPDIWRIRDDGSQLKKIVSFPSSSDPEFNYKGDKLMYSKHMNYTRMEVRLNPSLLLHNNNQIIDVHGRGIDSICQPDSGSYFCKPMYKKSWSASNRVLYLLSYGHVPDSYHGIGLFDYNTFERTVIFSEEYYGNINYIIDIHWHPGDTYFYYTTRQGLFLYHLQTGIREKIRTSCNSRRYNYFSVSSDGNKIIAERYDVVKKEERFFGWYLYIDNYLVIIDTDNYSEKRIMISD